MDNPKPLSTLGSQHTGRRQAKRKNSTQNTKKMSRTGPTKNKGEHMCSQRVRSSCFL